MWHWRCLSCFSSSSLTLPSVLLQQSAARSTCACHMSCEEEDKCMSRVIWHALCSSWLCLGSSYLRNAPRRFQHAHAMCHMRRRIHACHVSRRFQHAHAMRQTTPAMIPSTLDAEETARRRRRNSWSSMVVETNKKILQKQPKKNPPHKTYKKPNKKSAVVETL